jgi:hypothetical protein
LAECRCWFDPCWHLTGCNFSHKSLTRSCHGYSLWDEYCSTS